MDIRIGPELIRNWNHNLSRIEFRIGLESGSALKQNWSQNQLRTDARICIELGTDSNWIRGQNLIRIEMKMKPGMIMAMDPEWNRKTESKTAPENGSGTNPHSAQD